MSEENIFQEEQSDALLDLLIEQKTVKSPKLLTKSKYLNGLQCPKLLWTRCNAPQEIPEASASLQRIFDTGHQVGELATRRFPGGVYVQEDDFLKNLKETRKLLDSKDPRPIYEAGIQSGRLYARADIMRPSSKPGMWDVIEVKCSTKCKEVYLQDIAFQRHCYEQSGLLIDRCYLMHVDNTYVRDGDIDPEEFFTLLDVTEEIKPFCKEIPAQVNGFLKIIDLPNQPKISIREYCNKPYECQMKPICWAFLPESNVTQLYNGRAKKFDLLEQGVVLLKDIPDGYNLNDKQQIQRVCAISGREHIDKPEIMNFINGLRYPLYFMDFETIFEVIPRFDGIRPYQQVPFQFSIHIQKVPGGAMKHVSCLHKSGDDPRQNFIQSLNDCMGNDGTIIVYNQTFEDGRLKELGEAFEEFEASCQSMRNRMVDLLVPFRSFQYYHPEQKGSASIKKVLPALVGQGYEGLVIAEGGQASTEYVRVTYSKDVAATERMQVYADLEKYCTLDTKAMVDILEALRKII
jgi:Domain of unknown function(DUF2779)